MQRICVYPKLKPLKSSLQNKMLFLEPFSLHNIIHALIAAVHVHLPVVCAEREENVYNIQK